MKRIGNLYEKIYCVENLVLADKKARKGKKKQKSILEHDLNKDANILCLHEMLKNKIYKTSQYTTFVIRDPKERIIHRLPYFPDRIAHHAVMNVLEDIFVSVFTTDTYSCIKGKGIHAAAKSVKAALRNKEETKYCLKLDIKKFYPSVDHVILKKLVLRKFKDKNLLWLLDDIINSAKGLPIGNYLSQYLANFYLAYFDHWLKEVKKVKYYFRYADDMVILSESKEYLHKLLEYMREYLSSELNLTIKHNYQIFPVDARSIDFVGYKFYHTHTLLRKSIKKNFAKMIAKNKNPKSIAAYNGWAVHCDSNNLMKKLLHERV